MRTESSPSRSPRLMKSSENAAAKRWESPIEPCLVISVTRWATITGTYSFETAVNLQPADDFSVTTHKIIRQRCSAITMLAPHLIGKIDLYRHTPPYILGKTLPRHGPIICTSSTLLKWQATSACAFDRSRRAALSFQRTSTSTLIRLPISAGSLTPGCHLSSQ